MNEDDSDNDQKAGTDFKGGRLNRFGATKSGGEDTYAEYGDDYDSEDDPKNKNR